MKYVRAKQTETGHEFSVPEEHLAAAPEGAYKVLEDKPAVDMGGDPLPPKYMTTVDAEAAKKAAPVPYDKRRKAELEEEVATRNAEREGDDLIVVGGNGTIADLAAALDADDAAHDSQEQDNNEGEKEQS